jgi:hypothetical protein
VDDIDSQGLTQGTAHGALIWILVALIMALAVPAGRYSPGHG